jgi:hypothetical protein
MSSVPTQPTTSATWSGARVQADPTFAALLTAPGIPFSAEHRQPDRSKVMLDVLRHEYPTAHTGYLLITIGISLALPPRLRQRLLAPSTSPICLITRCRSTFCAPPARTFSTHTPPSTSAACTLAAG